MVNGNAKWCGGNHARHQPTHREQLGVQSLAQGLFQGEPGFELGTFREPVSKTVSLPLSHCRPIATKLIHVPRLSHTSVTSHTQFCHFKYCWFPLGVPRPCRRGRWQHQTCGLAQCDQYHSAGRHADTDNTAVIVCWVVLLLLLGPETMFLANDNTSALLFVYY